MAKPCPQRHRRKLPSFAERSREPGRGRSAALSAAGASSRPSRSGAGSSGRGRSAALSAAGASSRPSRSGAGSSGRGRSAARNGRP
ncbi:hypothetical protein [Paenibacillus illinoisensis]|uniref:hypothetical protein n=1 Tax=Paenibacillus illinoisensis TaxID=59845 RepID=UPI003D98D0DE